MPESLVFLAFLTILSFTSQPHCFLSPDFVITRLGSLMIRLQVQQPNKQTLIPLSIDIECSMNANFVQLSRSRSSSYVIKRPRREHIIELNWKTTLLARLHFQFVMFWLNLLIDYDFSFEGINSAKKRGIQCSHRVCSHRDRIWVTEDRAQLRDERLFLSFMWSTIEGRAESTEGTITNWIIEGVFGEGVAWRFHFSAVMMLTIAVYESCACDQLPITSYQ